MNMWKPITKKLFSSAKAAKEALEKRKIKKVEREDRFYADEALEKLVANGEISSQEAALRFRHFCELQALRRKEYELGR